MKNKAACTDEPPCNNTCGPEKTGLKTCTCVAGAWDCPSCTFPDGNDYSCYKLPDPLMPCPADSTDPTGANLPQSGGVCTQAMCMACGSATDPTYRDSSNSAKVGYCICNVNMKYACASLSEWPPQ